MKNIIIIGNSPNVMNNKYGDLINTYDEVIRINNFELKGYEEYVGNKTDKIFLTFATKYSDIIFNFDPKKLYLFTADKYDDKKFLKERISKGVKIDIEKVNILEKKYFYELNNKVGCVGKERCTTGLIATEWCLNNYTDSIITLYGFSFFEDIKNEIIPHYFSHNPKDNGYHNFNNEKKYFNNYINEGHLKILNKDNV
jgi:hypothetical protein